MFAWPEGRGQVEREPCDGIALYLDYGTGYLKQSV